MFTDYGGESGDDFDGDVIDFSQNRHAVDDDYFDVNDNDNFGNGQRKTDQ